MATAEKLLQQYIEELQYINSLQLPVTEFSYDPQNIIEKKHKAKTGKLVEIHKFFSSQYGKKLVCKITISDEEQYAVRHEAFVGLLALNKLTNIVPNFARIYGYRENVPYPPTPPYGGVHDAVFYEYISGPSLFEFYKVCTISELKSVFLQLFLALSYANEMVGFVHCDLHSHNVIIHILSEKYGTTFDGSVVTTSIYRPVMIDYGRSIVTVSGQHYFLLHDHDPKTRWRADVSIVLNVGRFYDTERIDALIVDNMDAISKINLDSDDEESNAAAVEMLINKNTNLIKLHEQAKRPAFVAKAKLLRQIAAAADIIFDKPYKFSDVTYVEFIDKIVPILRD